MEEVEEDMLWEMENEEAMEALRDEPDPSVGREKRRLVFDGDSGADGLAAPSASRPSRGGGQRVFDLLDSDNDEAPLTEDSSADRPRKGSPHDSLDRSGSAQRANAGRSRVRPRGESDVQTQLDPELEAVLRGEDVPGAEAPPPPKRRGAGSEAARGRVGPPDGAEFLHSTPCPAGSRACTLPDGRTVHLREAGLDPSRASPLAGEDDFALISGGDVSELLSRVHARTAERARQLLAADNDAEDDRTAAPPSGGPGESRKRAPGQSSAGKRSRRRTAAARGSGELWVDKYAPHRFTDLVSDGSVNEDVLRWLKAWDHFVHGKPRKDMAGGDGVAALFSATGSDRKGREEEGENQKKGPGGGRQWDKSRGGYRGGWRAAPPVDELQADGRPRCKVILLCGPAGMGKTTLAHVLAATAGYNVVEVNASDERGRSAVQRRLEDAMGSQALFGARRPNCIVLDEVDGVAGGEAASAVGALVDMVKRSSGRQTTQPDPTGGTAEGKRARRKAGSSRKGTAGTVVRPVICICNDLYAPALRPLRQHARVFTLRATGTHTLLSRLRVVCDRERVSASQAALAALCEATGNDVRSALNTLQFLHYRARAAAAAAASSSAGGRGNARAATSRAQITEAAVHGGAVGARDRTFSLFHAWHTIFAAPRPAATGAPRASGGDALQTAADRRVSGRPRTGAFSPGIGASLSALSAAGGSPLPPHVQHLLYRGVPFGELDRVVEGVFENAPTVGYLDPVMDKSSELAEWMSLNDFFGRRARARQQWTLMPVAGLTLPAAHMLCRVERRPTLRYPRQGQDARMRRQVSCNVVDGFVQLQRHASESLRHPTAVTLDALSAVVSIVSPALRPVPATVMNAGEKAAYAHLVKAMLATRLQYVARAEGEQDDGGRRRAELVLDPPIQSVCNFSALGDRQLLHPLLRARVNHDVELARIRMGAGGSLEDSVTTTGGAAESTPQGRAAKAAKDTPRAGIGKRNLRAEILSPAAQRSKSMQKLLGGGKSPQAEGRDNSAEPRSVVYRYQEGFTNAVRRPVFLSDFL